MGCLTFFVDNFMGETMLLTEDWGIPFMMQAFYATMLCSVVFVVVSLMTPPPPPEKIDGLTWESPLAVLTNPYVGEGVDPRYVAAVLVAVMAVLYGFFR